MKKNSNLDREMDTIVHFRNEPSLKCLILILGLTFLLTSCEGYRCADGTIYDSVTKEPIDSVQCTLTNGFVQYSDSLGKYSICNPFGGCVPDCPDIIVEFSKIGYQTKIVTNPNKSDIFLDKE